MNQAERLFQDAQKYHQKGNHKAALERYEKALKLNPQHSLARLFRALIWQQMGRTREALDEAHLALEQASSPSLPLLINFGVILKNAGQLEDAAHAYEKALEINPKLSVAKSNLGTIYLMQGRLDEARKLFVELTQTLEEPAPWLNLARIALLQGEHEQARELLQSASDLDPAHPDLFLLNARLAAREKDDETAFDLCLKGLDKVIANRELWQILQTLDRGVFDLDALKRRLVALSRQNVQSATVLTIAVDLCRKNWLWQPLPKLETMLAEALKNPIDKAPGPADCFTLLGANVPQAGHRASASACWRNLTGRLPRSQPPALQRKQPGEKLRVAFLSSDLRGHAIGYLVVGLFEHLPSEHIEWWAYNNAFADESQVRERLRSHFDRFINIAKLDDGELADKIREDKIDILIDLNQMTAENRVLVMARRPAPIQVQWLGMPGTLGAGTDVDYIIVDPWVVQPDNADGFSECLLQLPRSYQPNDHIPPDVRLSQSREEAGLPAQGVVFGCFNQYYKVSPDTFALWARILQQVPHSVLWLMDPDHKELHEQVRQQAQYYGIDFDRIIFAPKKPQAEHLARLRWMDLVLDTWPYNAHTTASDALRVGVPVLTLPGRTFASRVAAGILHTAGLSDWIATDAESYVQKAVSYGRNSRQQLDDIKADIHRQYWQSPMVDNAALGRMFEALMLGLYERHLAKQPLCSLKLTPDLKLIPLDFGRQDSITQPAANLQTENAADSLSTDSATTQAPEAWVDAIQRGGKKARMANLRLLQQQVLRLPEPPLVVDVGAASFDGKMDFETLCDLGLLSILGFEPDPESYAKLDDEQHKGREYVNVALGDGTECLYHMCHAPGMNSCLFPDVHWLDKFPKFAQWGQVVSTHKLPTTRLDDIEKALKADFIKLDTQGSELIILQHGVQVLRHAAMIQLELSPTPLYQNEPTLFQVGQWLYEQGFVLHYFSDINKRGFKPYASDDEPFKAINHVFQVDAVFMPDMRQWDQVDAERLLKLAFLAHSMYRSFDLAMCALEHLDQRDGGTRAALYATYLEKAGLYA